MFSSSSSLPYSYFCSTPRRQKTFSSSSDHKVLLSARARTQNFGEKGEEEEERENGRKWANRSNVDANMGALTARIEVVKAKERLQLRWNKDEENKQWFFPLEYDIPKLDREALIMESLAVAEVAAGTFGLTIVGCTACLCFISLVAHLVH